MVRIGFVFSCGLKSSRVSGTARHTLDRLVRLAGVSGDDVLEGRLDGLGHVGVGDGGEVVVHGRSPYFAGSTPTNFTAR